MPTRSTRSPTAETEALEELLEGLNVALEARHQPPDLGLVHEGQGDPLEVGVHGAAEVDQEPLGDPCHQRLLDQVGHEVGGDDQEKSGNAQREEPLAAGSADQRPIDDGAQDERDRDLAGDEGEHGQNARDELPAMRADESPEAPHDAAAEGGEYGLLGVDLGADDGPRRTPALRQRRPPEARPYRAHPGTRSLLSASADSPPRLCSS